MENIKQIATALVKAQSEMVNPKKAATNPFFKSKYADLNAVLEAVLTPLHTHGIVVLQPTVTIEGVKYVKTILLHESGEYLESFTEILFKANDAQAQGSGITYARRYGLQSFVCVGADNDDDGNKATAEKKATQQPSKQTPVLSKERFDLAMAAEMDVVTAFLKSITDKKLTATAEQILGLQNRVNELSSLELQN